jgi:hypothetical protein
MVTLNPIFGNSDLDINVISAFEQIEGRENDIQFCSDLKYKNWLIKFSKKEGGLNLLGHKFDPEIALKLCNCEIDPETKVMFKDIRFLY